MVLKFGLTTFSANTTLAVFTWGFMVLIGIKVFSVKICREHFWSEEIFGARLTIFTSDRRLNEIEGPSRW
jgi:hypothetical protein